MTIGNNTIREEVLGLLKGYEETADLSMIEGPRVHVSNIIGKLAFVYEKIRNSVDAKDEKLLHKYAILRILRRRVLTHKDHYMIAESLVKELIRAGYMPNDYIPEKLIDEIKRVIDKYFLLLAHLTEYNKQQETDELLMGLLDIAACEIEELLIPGVRERALVTAAFDFLRPRITYKNIDIAESDRDVQLYLACYRVFVSSDKGMLSYELLKLYFPDWQNANEVIILDVAQRFGAISHILKIINSYKLSQKLFKVVKRFAVPMLTVRDSVLNTEGPAAALQLISDKKAFNVAIRNAYVIRYSNARARLRKLATRAIIYMFITKMVIAVALEVPYDILIEKQLHLFAIGINVLFPPVLLFLMIVLMRYPRSDNLDLVVEAANEIADTESTTKHLNFEVAFKKKHHPLNSFLIKSLYVIIFLGVFYILISFLNNLHFNVASITMFLFFLSLVSFFGVRIRKTVQDLVFVERKENICTVILDFFSVPIIKSGRWLSTGLANINIFVVLLDWFIELPFKVLIDLIEDTSVYLKEKRDDGSL
jgi:hypothetical protein